jgi:hypothetical protein
MQLQQQSNWCWATVAASVAGYYATAGPSGGPWQQCEIVNLELGHNSCCLDGATATCNVPWYLELALTRVGHLARPPVGPCSFSYTKREIDLNDPVVGRIGWNGGGGHFVVLRGYDDGNDNEFVDVEDPWYGPSTLSHSVFSASYQNAGAWTHTYPIG